MSHTTYNFRKSYLEASDKCGSFLLAAYFQLLLSSLLLLSILLSHLFSSVVSHSLGRGRISCSQVGWFLGGVKRPDSRLKPAGLPPDTMYVKPRTKKKLFLRTQPAAGRRLQGGANPVISIRLPKGQGDPRQPGVEVLEVVLVALETLPLLLLALNSVEADQEGQPCSTQAGALFSLGFASEEVTEIRTIFGQVFFPHKERLESPNSFPRPARLPTL